MPDIIAVIRKGWKLSHRTSQKGNKTKQRKPAQYSRIFSGEKKKMLTQKLQDRRCKVCRFLLL